MWTNEIRDQAKTLRLKGASYKDICAEIGKQIPKGTLAHWCKRLELPEEVRQEHRRKQLIHMAEIQNKAVIVNAGARAAMLKGLRDINRPLLHSLEVTSVAKIALAMLYLGEGAKKSASIRFGNSSPDVIRLFLRLLRKCYSLDASKFRCVVQCRADQDIPGLERFWSNVTGIPLSKFRASRIDPRTVGKKTQKQDYKGVCVIDYFSAMIFNELLQVADLLCKGR